MFEQPSTNEPEKRAGKLRMFLRYTWFVHVGVLLVVGWIFFSRWDENRQLEQRALEKRRAEDRQTFEMLGGNRFEILQFYVSPPLIRRGGTAQVCYGVSNAKTVRIEPQPASGVWPSLNRCVEVSPSKDTTYTLTATDATGQTKTATVEVKVSSKNGL